MTGRLLRRITAGVLCMMTAGGMLFESCTATVDLPSGVIDVSEDGVIVRLPGVSVDVTDDGIVVDVPCVNVDVSDCHVDVDVSCHSVNACGHCGHRRCGCPCG